MTLALRICITGLLLCLPAAAQSTFGSIVGSIQDKSSAMVGAVAVHLLDLDQNTSRDTLSGPQGLYEFLNLRPGRYSIEARKPGFAIASISAFSLDARQERRVDIALEVEGVAGMVQVTSEAAVIDTENGTIADTKNFQQVTQLPLNYRGGTTSPLAALVAVPGVTQDANNRISLAGGLPSMVEFTVDGTSTVNIRNNGANANMYPSSELLGEFRVSSVSNNAEFASAGDVTVSTKSGGNRFHGSAFEYLQNRALDATIYGSTNKQAKVWNTFGGSVGGPVVIPHIYNGRDKTFFFADYEGNRRPGSTLQTYLVPNAQFRSGNLNGLPGGAVVDPNNGLAFPNNQVPQSRLSSVSQTLLSKYYPLPNSSSTSAYNFQSLVPLPNTTDGYDIRVDQYISAKHQIFGRWSWKNLPHSGVNTLLPATTYLEYNRNFTVSDNYVFSPSLVNEFRFGLSRWTNDQNFPVDGATAVKTLGITGLDLKNATGYGGFPGFDFSDGTGFTAIGQSKLGATFSGNYQFTDNLSWVHGKHTVKVGGDFRRVQYKDVQNFGGSDDFGAFTFSSGAFTGNAFADLLLGLPASNFVAVTGPYLNQTSNHFALYAQDEFRLTPKLTINFGLRWEVLPPFSEANGNITNFDPKTGQVITPDKTLPAAPGFLYSINAPCPGVTTALPCTNLINASKAGLPEGLRQTYKADFAPRFSIAYRPFGNNKTVVRGGFGLFTLTPLGPLAYALTGIHTTDARTFQNYFGPGKAPAYQFPQAFAGSLTPDAIGTGEFIVGTSLDYRDPQSAQWNLTFERELPKNFSLRTSYIGMNSYRLTSTVDLNQVAPSTTAYNPASRPYPNWGRILVRSNTGFANYQSFNAQLDHHFSDGFFIQGSYTLAKNLTNDNGDAPSSFSTENGATLADRFNTRNIRGNDAGTRRNRALVTAIYEVPFAKNRKYLSNVLGGWQVSTVSMFQTGPYRTPTISRTREQANINAVGRGVTLRPDRIGDGNVSDPNPNHWWDASAFAPTPAGAGRVGNAGVGILEGPGTIAVAGGLSKNIAVFERLRLRFDATFTNLLNHPNFASPGTNILTKSTFGITQTVQAAENSGNRVGQLSLRLDF